MSELVGAQSRLPVDETTLVAPFEAMDDAFCVIKVLFREDRPVDYRFLEVNDTFVEQTGLEDAIGRTMRELAPAHEAHWFEIYGAVAVSGEPTHFEAPAGALRRRYDVFAYRVGKPEEHRVGILFRDITERHLAEMAWHESAARYQALATASADVLYRMSPDWGEMRELDGRGFLSNTAEPSDSWLSRYIHPDDQPRVMAAVEDAVRSKQPFDLEHRVLRADGTLGWAASRAVPLLDRAGAVVEWIGAASDVTSRREAEEAVRASEERQRFLVALGDALRPIDDPVTVEAAGTRRLGERLHAAHVWIVTLDMEADLAIVERDYVTAGTPSLTGRYRATDFSMIVDGLRGRRAFVVNDVMLDSRFGEDERNRTRSLSFGAFVAAPIFTDDTLVAMLGVGETAPRQWTAHEIGLIEETAARLWPELLRARAQQGLREREARRAFLLELADQLRPVVDPAEVTRVASEALGRHLRLDRCAYAAVDPAGEVTFVDVYRAPGISALPRRLRRMHAGDPVLSFLRADETLVIGDATADPRLTDGGLAQYFDSARINAAVGIPVVKRGRVAAVLLAHQARARQWTDSDLALIDEAAERIWAAVERAATEQRVLERERAGRQEAERAARLREEFLATVSHELRTPLAAILLWSRLLSGGRVLGREREAMDMIERNAEIQRVLIEDLLDTSRAMAGAITLDRADTEVGGVVERVIASLRPSATERGIDLSVVRIEAIHAWLDSQRFGQVVRNIADNALRYTAPGGRVGVRVFRDGDHAAVEVRDTGKGFDRDLRARMFDRFERGSDGAAAGGLGLGLAIARDLVELHGGSIDGASDGPGHGSVFTVRLPAVKSSRRHRSPDSNQGADPPSTRSLSGKVVLVAEDDPDTLEALRILLDREGATVVVGASGRDALDTLGRAQRPDVVLTDLLMDGMDGYELLREIYSRRRRDPGRWQHVPVIALSGAVRPGHSATPEPPFDAVIEKPVNGDEVIAAINRVIATSKSNRRRA